MLWANLNMTTRRTLLEKSLPLHFYLEVLLHQSAAVRDLAKDTLQIVNAAPIVVNSYGAADLPVDFVDEIAVGLPIGGDLMPIPKRSTLNPLRSVDSSGAFVPYSTANDNEVDINFFNGNPFGVTWFWNVNDFGEPTGRFFGASGGVSYGYEIFRQRRQIQFTGNFVGEDTSSMVLLYISNGQHIDNASQIDFRAFRAIQTYSDWQMSPNATMKDAPEARTFYNEKRLLRAEMDDLTVDEIRNIIYRSYTATYKT